LKEIWGGRIHVGERTTKGEINSEGQKITKEWKGKSQEKVVLQQIISGAPVKHENVDLKGTRKERVLAKIRKYPINDRKCLILWQDTRARGSRVYTSHTLECKADEGKTGRWGSRSRKYWI